VQQGGKGRCRVTLKVNILHPVLGVRGVGQGKCLFSCFMSFGLGSEERRLKILPSLHQRSLHVRHPNKAVCSFQRAKCEVIHSQVEFSSLTDNGI